jgi:glycosyltransferase involved in cell wall biosynthesis
MALLQILYYTILFSRFAFHKQQPPEAVNPPISIVITAKNDAHHLINTLPLLLTQDYHTFEVVVVNDKSNDETLEMLFDFQNQYPNLKSVNLESSVTNIKGKKFPLSLGIKSAKYEHILLTDADCIPQSNQWVKFMARHFNSQTKIVLGFHNLTKKVGFFNSLIRFDKLHQAIQYFSCCLAKIPYMGVGQNLAYTKTVFFSNNGFASQNHLRFGDDDLFINQVSTATNCAIEYDKNAHTTSRPSSNFNNWFLLKIFRSRTRKYYKTADRLLLNFYYFLMAFFYLALGFVLYFTLNNLLYLSIVTGILTLKLITQYLCFGFAAAKLNEKRLIPYILIFDIIYSALNPVVYVVSKFKK